MHAIIDYDKIIEAICYVKGIKRHESLKILKNRDCKYVLFLLIKKYKCKDVENDYKDFLVSNKRVMSYGLRKAEERFFFNKEFREMYFQIENTIEGLN